MRAKVVKGIDRNNLEADIWMIMIQKEKGKQYSVGLLNNMHKPYYTLHKEEADELCKSLNKKFQADGSIPAK